jgi:transcriptional regulator with XRE-family HTH domain
MNKPASPTYLPYEAKARIADNVFLLRKRAGYSQEELSRLAMVSVDRIGKIENGHVTSKFDSYVRLAGSLAVPVHDLLAGVTWTPASIEMEIDAVYEVELDQEAPDAP